MSVDPFDTPNEPFYIPEELKRAVKDIVYELLRATANHGPMYSAHEGHSIIEEEYEELKEHVFTKQGRRDVEAMRAEAVQLGAMALRFIIDIVDSGNGQR